MALVAPSPQQRRFAGQIAWERGQKIINWPKTSSELSGLIRNLQSNFDVLPVEDWQLDRIKRLVRDSAAQIEGFDPEPYSELPEDRASANKVIFDLDRKLGKAKFHAARTADVSNYVAAIGSEEATAAVAETSSSSAEDEIPF